MFLRRENPFHSLISISLFFPFSPLLHQSTLYHFLFPFCCTFVSVILILPHLVLICPLLYSPILPSIHPVFNSLFLLLNNPSHLFLLSYSPPSLLPSPSYPDSVRYFSTSPKSGEKHLNCLLKESEERRNKNGT